METGTNGKVSQMRKWIFVACLLCMSAGFPGRLAAEVVHEVAADGSLVLEGGKQVVLAGVQLDAEGVSVLRALVQNQDLSFRGEAPGNAGNEAPVYAYLRTQSLKFPSKPDAVSEEKEVMINEFLISQGAARVAETPPFAEKDHFLKIQELAREKGEGVWSYEKF